MVLFVMVLVAIVFSRKRLKKGQLLSHDGLSTGNGTIDT